MFYARKQFVIAVEAARWYLLKSNYQHIISHNHVNSLNNDKNNNIIYPLGTRNHFDGRLLKRILQYDFSWFIAVYILQQCYNTPLSGTTADFVIQSNYIQQMINFDWIKKQKTCNFEKIIKTLNFSSNGDVCIFLNSIGFRGL